jgi:hypothetical protein
VSDVEEFKASKEEEKFRRTCFVKYVLSFSLSRACVFGITRRKQSGVLYILIIVYMWGDSPFSRDDDLQFQICNRLWTVLLVSMLW